MHGILKKKYYCLGKLCTWFVKNVVDEPEKVKIFETVRNCEMNPKKFCGAKNAKQILEKFLDAKLMQTYDFSGFWICKEIQTRQLDSPLLHLNKLTYRFDRCGNHLFTLLLERTGKKFYLCEENSSSCDTFHYAIHHTLKTIGTFFH